MATTNESKSHNKIGHRQSFRNWISLTLSVIAILVSGSVAYWGTLQPFSLEIWVDPIVQIQHRNNFGVHTNVSFRNESPKSGLVTALAMVINRSENPEDRYLLVFAGFRKLEMVDSSVAVYRTLEEHLPVFIEPRQWALRTASFIYDTAEQFPISMGTYDFEILVWTNYEERARYREVKKFFVDADILAKYQDRREKGSTWLEPILSVGSVPKSSKKLTNAEYQSLIR